MGKGRKLLAAAVSAMLAASLVPVSAFAADASSTADASSFIYELGTYVEHEAIAYVVDGGVQLFSLGDDVLAGAQSLMAIDAEAADEARGGDTVARSGASLLSASADVRAQSGRLVVVRDESKTAEQLVAELEADPRVVFAEPNAVVQSADARDETAALDAANQAVAKDLSDGVTAPDEGEEGTPAKTVSPVPPARVTRLPSLTAIPRTRMPVLLLTLPSMTLLPPALMQPISWHPSCSVRTKTIRQRTSTSLCGASITTASWAGYLQVRLSTLTTMTGKPKRPILL